MNAEAVIRAIWDAMASNDFTAASQYLTEDFEGYWPQARELITGRGAFAGVNSAYPAAGRWHFDVQRVIASGTRRNLPLGPGWADREAVGILARPVSGPGLAGRMGQRFGSSEVPGVMGCGPNKKGRAIGPAFQIVKDALNRPRPARQTADHPRGAPTGGATCGRPPAPLRGGFRTPRCSRPFAGPLR